jgi:predicted PurR-regulated permease PerM
MAGEATTAAKDPPPPAAEARPGSGERLPPGALPSPSLFARRRVRIVFLVLIALATLVVAYAISDVLNPLLLSLLIAYVLHPGVRFLERRLRLPRTLAVVVIYLAALGGAAGIVAYSIGRTSGEVDRLMTRAAGGWQRAPSGAPAAPPGGAIVEADPSAPVYGDDQLVPMAGSTALAFLDLDGDGKRGANEPIFSRAETGGWQLVAADPVSAGWRRCAGYLDRLKDAAARRWALIDPRVIETIVEKAKSNTAAIASAGATLWKWITAQLFGGIVTVVGYFVLVPIYTFFLVRGFDRMVAGIDAYLPGLHRDRVRAIARRIDRACAAFFRGRFLICMGKAVFVWLGLWAAGVEFALTIGMVTGALSIVPAVGPIVGFALAALFAYGPTGFGTRVIEAAAVFVAAEALEAIANPVVLGREVGLHPVTLLFSLFVFGDLLGFLGVLLAVPLAAIVKILVEEIVLPELKYLAEERPGAAVSGFFRKTTDGQA